jgi:hypothetical protein
MSTQNCYIRSLTQLGKRQHGVSLDSDWVAEAGLSVGERVGIDRREGEYADRGATVLLGDYDPNTVDYERTLGDRDGTVVVSLPPGIREWLDAELKESVYVARSADGDAVLIEAP